MKSEKQQMLRLALAIRDRFVERIAPPVILPVADWEDLCNKTRRVQRAQARGLRLAAVKLKEESVFALQRVRDQITAVLAAEADSQIARAAPSAGEIYQDLTALHEEFDDVSWSLREGSLSVTTDPIVLEGMYLGAFRIELQWAELPVDSAYSIIAVDPTPAASNESVTHPHVENEMLCSGDGRATIRLALVEGRLADFFLIVTNILRTYNSASAYVTLDAWEGTPCADCGSHVGEDERILCAQCDSPACNDCSVFCERCQSSYCSECCAGCSACNGGYCKDCLRTCPACKKLVCCNCLLEEDCEWCHDEEKPEHESPQSVAANRLCSTAAAV